MAAVIDPATGIVVEVSEERAQSLGWARPDDAPATKPAARPSRSRKTSKPKDADKAEVTASAESETW